MLSAERYVSSLSSVELCLDKILQPGSQTACSNQPLGNHQVGILQHPITRNWSMKSK